MALSKKEKSELVKEFGQGEHDTGSVEVQVAMLTEDIRLLTAHLKRYSQDFSSKRGLLKKVSQRRSFLKYLERTEPKKYLDMVSRLGLKK